MLPHALTEGEIPFVRSANGNGNRIPLNGILFNRIPLNGIPFPFVSVKTNFEGSVKISFPLMALCFRVNP